MPRKRLVRRNHVERHARFIDTAHKLIDNEHYRVSLLKKMDRMSKVDKPKSRPKSDE